MLRKKPTQDRSKQRLERIVEAATHEFAEVGFDAATTEQIAARAGVSIGSVYRFFPNKRALFDAVWARYFDQIRSLVDTFLSEEKLERPWEQLLDEAVDALFWFHRSSPGFRAIFSSLQLSPELLAADQALSRDVVKRLAKVFERFTTVDRKHREIVASVVVETLSGILMASTRASEANAKALAAESKVLLRRYLAPYTK